MSADPVHYTPDVERILPDQAEVIGELREAFEITLETTASDDGRAVRSVRAAQHGLREGRLLIDPVASTLRAPTAAVKGEAARG